MPKLTATAQQILEIRSQAAAGVLKVRSWADALGCSLETVRRYARGDSARHLIGLKWGKGGLPPATNGERTVEPSEGELAASLARLSKLTAQVDPRKSVDDLLAELTHKGEER